VPRWLGVTRTSWRSPGPSRRLLPGAGGPEVNELELTEPSVFLNSDPGAPERFARAIAQRL
jgi:hypothetical protein